MKKEDYLSKIIKMLNQATEKQLERLYYFIKAFLS